MKKEELIQEIAYAIKRNDDKNEGTSSYINYASQVYEDIFIPRNRLLLEKIGKPLRCAKDGFFSSSHAIDEALAIIEKEGGE